MISTPKALAEKGECAIDCNEHLPQGASRDDFTADALAALARLDTHGDEHVALMLHFGETVVRAKSGLDHGKFSRWCREVLNRSPSWVSAHRRLFDARADLELARAWGAANNHKWAHRLSVERLLTLISEWKMAMRGDGAAAPRTRREKRAPVAHVELEEVAAQLGRLIGEAQRAFETARYELWWTIPRDDSSAREELVELGKCFRWHLRELGECCCALHTSRSGKSPYDLPPIDDAPEAWLLQ